MINFCWRWKKQRKYNIDIELIGKLNGKKILIKGNHDKKYDSELFEKICYFKTVSLNGEYFALMHYPVSVKQIIEFFNT